MTTSTAAIVDEQLTAPVVGVDVGGTKIAAALVSADGGLLGPVAEAPTPAREGAQAVLDAIASSVTTLIDTGAPAARRVRLAPVAVGIGSAGVIDAGRGVGLDIIKDRIVSLNGTVNVASRPHGYTRFVFTLPKLG